MKFVSKAVVLSAAAGIAVVGGAGMASAHDHGGANAAGGSVGSPGVISGNVIQVPIHLPVNVCGNSINIIGLLNPAFGNTCINK
ncbi:chaplin [Streptomyces sp. NPDC057743]|uniref:chaplin n=1 Tax=Streptomyces sp. NPDC057743 TaxID=3346236 RepID=UPI00369128D3